MFRNAYKQFYIVPYFKMFHLGALDNFWIVDGIWRGIDNFQLKLHVNYYISFLSFNPDVWCLLVFSLHRHGIFRWIFDQNNHTKGENSSLCIALWHRNNFNVYRFFHVLQWIFFSCLLKIYARNHNST